MPDGTEFSTIVITLIVLLGSIALHEFAHAKSADSYGDDTPRLMGRVTLNPLAHLDPIGTVMILVTVFSGYGIGWGKPVMVNPSKMQNPRWDDLFCALWGPLTNVIIAVVIAFIFRLTGSFAGGLPPLFIEFCILGVTLNIALAAFNLIPIGPLDGHWILGRLLPPEIGQRFMHWSRTQGSILLLLIIALGQLSDFDPLAGYYRNVVWPAAFYLLGI